MAEVLLETLLLKAGLGLRFLDAWSGQPVPGGLRCALLRKRDGRVLAQCASTPSGVHHWPGLRAPWSAADLPPDASPPSPPSPALAEILVEDSLNRFLALRLDWPPLPNAAGDSPVTVTLQSAPQRLAPPGPASVAGLLIGDSGLPAAWARLLVTDAAGRITEGMSDAAGCFALHLPFPRPDRRSAGSSPASPPDPVSVNPGASATLRVFHDASVGIDAAHSAATINAAGPGTPASQTPAAPGSRVAMPPGGAPLARLWRAQPEVRALARIASADSLGPLRLEPGRPAVPLTEGLSPNRSELRLAPL